MLMTRLVRLSEEEWLARPDPWTPEGLAEYLREAGVDPGRPYRQEESAERGWLFDDILAENAEEFVKEYVQRGGE